MAGNPTQNAQPKAPTHSPNHPLKLCDQCGKQGEPAGGVLVRNKWMCAQCWIKYVNGR